MSLCSLRGLRGKLCSFSHHLLTACTASFGPITLSDGMNCAQASDEELGFAFSWLEWRRKQMIQLIINRSLSKSKPFWQPMTKNPLNCLRVFAISSLPILNNCSLAACLQYNPQGVWIDCSNIFTVDSFSLYRFGYEGSFVCWRVENHLTECIQLSCPSPRL